MISISETVSLRRGEMLSVVMATDVVVSSHQTVQHLNQLMMMTMMMSTVMLMMLLPTCTCSKAKITPRSLQRLTAVPYNSSLMVFTYLLIPLLLLTVYFSEVTQCYNGFQKKILGNSWSWFFVCQCQILS